MKEETKKFLNSTDSEINKKMDALYEAFGRILDKNEKWKLPREVILIQGYFLLLTYNFKGEQQGESSILDLFRTNLEAFKSFLEMKTDYNEYRVPPCSIISNDEMNKLIISDSLTKRGLGAVESYNLVLAILEHLRLHSALRNTGGCYYNTLDPTLQ